MPSIAQQDYLRPRCKSVNDCHLLAALAHNIQYGTIFDTIIVFEAITGDDDETRPIAYDADHGAGANVIYYNSANGEVSTIAVPYTQTQYEGLAAIQDGVNDYETIPALIAIRGHLVDEVSGEYVCVDDKFLSVTVSDDNKIATIAISDESAVEGQEEWENISWEDAQKLIGLPVTDND